MKDKKESCKEFIDTISDMFYEKHKGDDSLLIRENFSHAINKFLQDPNTKTTYEDRLRKGIREAKKKKK